MGTELRVRIIEQPDGDLSVTWQATSIDGSILIPLRLSHVLGQLNAAAFILANRSYTPPPQDK